MTKPSRQTTIKEQINLKERRTESSDNKEIIQANELPKERVIKKNMRQLGGTKTRKTRRSRKIYNALQTFRILHVNISGLKSKVNSLADIIAEKYPSVICLVETHLAKEDTISIEGYDLIFRNDSTSDSGGILIACENRLRSITVQVDEYSEVGQTLFIKLDNRRVQLRIGTIYAPQESRTPN